MNLFSVSVHRFNNFLNSVTSQTVQKNDSNMTVYANIQYNGLKMIVAGSEHLKMIFHDQFLP